MADSAFRSIQLVAGGMTESGEIRLSSEISAGGLGDGEVSTATTTVMAQGSGSVETMVQALGSTGSDTAVEPSEIEASTAAAAAGDEAGSLSRLDLLLQSDDDADLVLAEAFSGASGEPDAALAEAVVVPSGQTVLVQDVVPDLTFDVVAGQVGLASSTADYLDLLSWPF